MGWSNHQLDKLRENGNKRGGILTSVAHFLADSPSLAEPIIFLWIKSKIAKDHVVEKGNSVQTWLFWVSTVDVSSAYYISYSDSDIQCIIIQ